MELTSRQQWTIMRDLVGENNNSLRKMFASAISADIYDYYYRQSTAGSDVPKKTVEAIKSYKISNGVREIYKACADNFLQNDFYGARRYLDMQDSKQNWLDYLSTVDLFYYYNFQTKVLQNLDQLKDLKIGSAIKTINETPLSKYFSGKVSFSGKPDKEPGDKQKIDKRDFELRAQVLHDLALSEHVKYCESKGINPEKNEEKVMTKCNFGEYSGRVASRYFQQREILRQQREESEQFYIDQSVLQSEQPKWIGFDDQYSPLYELPNGKYQTSTGEDYSGPIFALEDDIFVMVGSTEEDVFDEPTDESEFDNNEETISQTPLNKQNLAPNTQTAGSEEVQ